MLTTHRQVPNRRREQQERLWALVEQRLAGQVICGRCRATHATMGEKCAADLGERCPGFDRVDAERAKAAREVGLVSVE